MYNTRVVHTIQRYTGAGSVDVPDLPAVPDGFTAVHDDEGNVYYIDDKTESTSWDHPHADTQRGEDVTFGAPQQREAPPEFEHQFTSWDQPHSDGEKFETAQHPASSPGDIDHLFDHRESEGEFSFGRDSFRSDLRLTL